MKTLLAAVIAALSLGLAAPAAADPYHDPYHPDYIRGWCPGGGTNEGVGVSYSNLTGWCNGVQYPDGTFWHQNRHFDGSGSGGKFPALMLSCSSTNLSRTVSRVQSVRSYGLVGFPVLPIQ